jgi:hypothetical protein
MEKSESFSPTYEAQRNQRVRNLIPVCKACFDVVWQLALEVRGSESLPN